MQIIHTKQQEPYLDEFNKLLVEEFSDPSWTYNPSSYEHLRTNDFFLINFVHEENKITSYASMMVTTKSSIESLVEGKIKENEILPYPKGEYEPGYLFWMALILKKRTQGPFLLHSIFKELVSLMKDWKFNIRKVVAIAYTKLSHRILKNHHFKQVGLYENKYPIMMIDVMDNVWLKAFIPYIKPDSTPPWPGKVDEPVPEIDREHKTQFDR